ncbi:hypothetical protein RDI58_034222 [Solanum bulbocastanum]
MESLCSKPRFK